MKLEGKAAIVTGATRGIGRQIAITLAQEGADVIINGNNVEKLGEVKQAVENLGRGCEIVAGDIAQPETSVRMASTCIEAFGKIDILVNNAGLTAVSPSWS